MHYERSDGYYRNIGDGVLKGDNVKKASDTIGWLIEPRLAEVFSKPVQDEAAEAVAAMTGRNKDVDTIWNLFARYRRTAIKCEWCSAILSVCFIIVATLVLASAVTWRWPQILAGLMASRTTEPIATIVGIAATLMVLLIIHWLAIQLTVRQLKRDAELCAENLNTRVRDFGNNLAGLLQSTEPSTVAGVPLALYAAIWVLDEIANWIRYSERVMRLFSTGVVIVAVMITAAFVVGCILRTSLWHAPTMLVLAWVGLSAIVLWTFFSGRPAGQSLPSTKGAEEVVPVDVPYRWRLRHNTRYTGPIALDRISEMLGSLFHTTAKYLYMLRVWANTNPKGIRTQELGDAGQN